MTSNLGSQIIRERFEGVEGDDELFAASETSKVEVMDLLKRTMRPEFLNRIDEVIIFKPLRKTEIADIVRIQLTALSRQLMQQGIEVGFTEEAIEYLADLGFDPQFGARPLKRVIQREVINELSRRILANEVKST